MGIRLVSWDYWEISNFKNQNLFKCSGEYRILNFLGRFGTYFFMSFKVEWNFAVMSMSEDMTELICLYCLWGSRDSLGIRNQLTYIEEQLLQQRSRNLDESQYLTRAGTSQNTVWKEKLKKGVEKSGEHRWKRTVWATLNVRFFYKSIGKINCFSRKILYLALPKR